MENKTIEEKFLPIVEKYVKENPDYSELSLFIAGAKHMEGLLQETKNFFTYDHMLETKARVKEIKKKLEIAREVLSLIASDSEFNCEIGEGNQRAAARGALEKIGEGK